MALSNNAKLGIVAAVAAGGLFFLTRDAGAAEPDKTATTASSLGDVAGCSAGTADAKANVAKKNTTVLAPIANAAFTASGLGTSSMSDFASAFLVAYNRCYDENKVTTTTGGTTKPKTIIFSPSLAISPGAAHEAAQIIATTLVPESYAATHPEAVGDDGTFKNLASYALAGMDLTRLQTTSGLTVDGKYGTQTQRAFDYWYLNS